MGLLTVLLLSSIPIVSAFDWGDFHKVAVIFFSFFGPGVILGAIAIVAYFACVRSWYESIRDEIRETHRSFHPWPPGSAKWQLQQFITGKGPPPAQQLRKLQPPVPPPPSAIATHRLLEMSTKNLMSPGQLVSPMPQTSARPTQPSFHSQTSLRPETSIIVEDGMNHYTAKPTSPLTQPLEVNCAPSTTYVPYRVTSPQDTSGSTQGLSPGYTMVDKTQMDDMNMRLHSSPNATGRQLEAIAVRTTTTTRRTTVLSPVQQRPYTVV